MKPKILPQSTSLRVCIDQQEDGCIAGRVYSQRLTQPLLFHDITDLLLQMEAVLDQQKFPQAFQRKRVFSTASSVRLPAADLNTLPFLTEEQVQGATPGISSFWISILSRQNTSWQGQIIWSEPNDIQNFSSALDLIRLMNARLFSK